MLEGVREWSAPTEKCKTVAPSHVSGLVVLAAIGRSVVSHPRYYTHYTLEKIAPPVSASLGLFQRALKVIRAGRVSKVFTGFIAVLLFANGRVAYKELSYSLYLPTVAADGLPAISLYRVVGMARIVLGLTAILPTPSRPTESKRGYPLMSGFDRINRSRAVIHRYPRFSTSRSGSSIFMTAISCEQKSMP